MTTTTRRSKFFNPTIIQQESAILSVSASTSRSASIDSTPIGKHRLDAIPAPTGVKMQDNVLRPRSLHAHVVESVVPAHKTSGLINPNGSILRIVHVRVESEHSSGRKKAGVTTQKDKEHPLGARSNWYSIFAYLAIFSLTSGTYISERTFSHAANFVEVCGIHCRGQQEVRRPRDVG